MSEDQTWPLNVNINLVENTQGTVLIRPGLATLVGPNGTGKTRALREIKRAVASVRGISDQGRKVHLLAAGRISPMERFRSAVDHPNSIERSDAAVGATVYQTQWWNYESITGVLLGMLCITPQRMCLHMRAGCISIPVHAAIRSRPQSLHQENPQA